MVKHIALVPVYVLVDSVRVVRAAGAARAAARVRTAAGAATGSMFGDEGRATPITEKGSRETALSTVSGAHTRIHLHVLVHLM